MRLHRLLSSFNSKYATGEFLLIVIGITVALAANSWYENQLLRDDEIRYLQRIRASLVTDLEIVSSSQAATEDTVARLHGLREHLEARAPYSEVLDQSFADLQFFSSTTLKTSIYESLRARGLELISNEEIQFALIDLYEDHNDALVRQNANMSEIAFSQMIPYVRQHFRVDNRSAVPYDYQSLLEDRYYLNLINAKLMG